MTEAQPRPDKEWVKQVCKVGQSHDCCRYLLMAPDGWSCGKHTNLHTLLNQRVAARTMVARGDNCTGRGA